jgi:hypothetical protein
MKETYFRQPAAYYLYNNKVKVLTRTLLMQNVRAILITGRGGPQGCGMSRILHFLHHWLSDGNEIVSVTHQPRFTPGRFLVLISVAG